MRHPQRIILNNYDFLSCLLTSFARFDGCLVKRNKKQACDHEAKRADAYACASIPGAAHGIFLNSLVIVTSNWRQPRGADIQGRYQTVCVTYDDQSLVKHACY